MRVLELRAWVWAEVVRWKAGSGRREAFLLHLAYSPEEAGRFWGSQVGPGKHVLLENVFAPGRSVAGALAASVSVRALWPRGEWAGF